MAAAEAGEAAAHSRILRVFECRTGVIVDVLDGEQARTGHKLRIAEGDATRKISESLTFLRVRLSSPFRDADAMGILP